MSTTAFTLRLDTKVSKKLDTHCRKHGYSKTGLVKKLIEECLDKTEHTPAAASLIKNSADKFMGLVGIVSLGGNAVEDSEDYWS